MRLIFSLLFLPLLISAQEINKIKFPHQETPSVYDTDLLSKEFHRERREQVRKHLPDSGFAIFFSSSVKNRSNDVDFQYHQDPNFYYLTGHKEPNSLIIIFKNTVELDSIKTNEIIFVEEAGGASEVWNGKKLGVQNAVDQLGISTAMPNYKFTDINFNQPVLDSVLFFKPPADVIDDKDDRGDLYSLIAHFKQKMEQAPLKKDMRNLHEIMAKLRQVKTSEEMKLLRKAVDMTCEAQKELMRALVPGMKEYETQAIVEYVFKKNGSEYPGYPSILGSGENSCVLHYSSNRKLLNDNDLLLSDVGAEYHGYTADITRTIPAKGKYSAEEKAIYDIVLEAQNAGIAQCVKGNNFWEPHQAATKVIQQGLLKLGIITKESDYRNYFMHGTSHYLGLDVHDAGLYGRLAPGNVVTVEPGIYIPAGSDCDPKWWNIGIRIEDDILITENTPENLSASLPRTIEEIELLMKEESIFNKK